MAHANVLKLYHSKSTAAADGEAGYDGLGGKMSANVVGTGLVARPLVITTGVTITFVAGNNLAGEGSLMFNSATKTLRWIAPGEQTAGGSVDVSVNGNYSIESVNGDKFIEVSVVAADLPTSDTNEIVVLDQVENNLFPNIDVNNVMSGAADYRCFFLKNISQFTARLIRPRWSAPAGNTTVEASAFYPQSGAIRLRVTDASNFPFGYYIRNVRTKEIMYYQSRGGSDGNELVVPPLGRRQRNTSPAEGHAGDLIELIAPFDISMAPYGGSNVTIPLATMAPLGISFWYPSPSTLPQSQTTLTLAPQGVATIWLRRNTPKGAVDMAQFPARLAFQFDADIGD